MTHIAWGERIDGGSAMVVDGVGVIEDEDAEMTFYLTDEQAEAVIALLEQEADGLAEEWDTIAAKKRVLFLRTISNRLTKAREKQQCPPPLPSSRS